MRLYDRIDISEGIDIDKTMHQKTIISLQWLSWFNAKAIAFNDIILFLLEETIIEFIFGI